MDKGLGRDSAALGQGNEVLGSIMLHWYNETCCQLSRIKNLGFSALDLDFSKINGVSVLTPPL